jgi:hypothetical protein
MGVVHVLPAPFARPGTAASIFANDNAKSSAVACVYRLVTELIESHTGH